MSFVSISGTKVAKKNTTLALEIHGMCTVNSVGGGLDDETQASYPAGHVLIGRSCQPTSADGAAPAFSANELSFGFCDGVVLLPTQY
jgi:hypothetical protein